MTRLHSIVSLVQSHSKDALTARHNPRRPARGTATATAADREDEDAGDGQGQDEIAFTSAYGRVTYQVVIDRVGHGVAPDQPVLVPAPALAPVARAVAFAVAAENGQQADDQGAQQSDWQWKRRDSVELGLVGAAVFIVALVVVAIARRQQRAYDRQQQQQLQLAVTEEAASEGDLETGAHVDSDMQPANSSSGDAAAIRGDGVATPASVDEGCV